MKWFLPILILLGGPAAAHEWYELSCCDEQHCSPVPDGTVEEGKDGVIVQNFGILSYTDPRLRWSKDNRDHLCILRGYKPKLLCVYRKPKGM
jgi:hypothetical protein